MNTSRRLVRSSTDRIIGGVAGGVANYLNIDPTLVRVAFVLFVLAGGVSPLIYLVLWAVLPSETTLGQNFSQQVRSNIADIEQRASGVVRQVGQFVNNQTGSSTAPTQPSAQNQTPDQQGPSTGPTTRL